MIIDAWPDASRCDLHLLDDNGTKVSIKNKGELSADFFRYAEWYLDTANSVICYMINHASVAKDIAVLDVWFFGMMFLYRHSLELIIKAAALKHPNHYNDKQYVRCYDHKLYDYFTDIIDDYELTDEHKETVEWLSKLFLDIDNEDNGSDLFRYPFNWKLSVSFDNQEHISLICVKQNMNFAYECIKCIYNNGSIIVSTAQPNNSVLLPNGGGYYLQSVVGYRFGKFDYYPYFESYVDIAQFVKQLIIEKNRTELFLPMCYLYRNAIELGIKRIMFEDSHTDNKKIIDRIGNHSLLTLWNTIKDEIISIDHGASANDNTIDNTEKYIKLLHSYDPKASTFRYPCDRDGVTFFLKEEFFTVENIAFFFEGILNVLDGIHDEMNYIKENEETNYW